jgi:hypothetical protein
MNFVVSRPTMATPRSDAAPARHALKRAPRPVALGNQALLRRLQAKLTIGAVNDPLEREADAVADQVMRMPDPAMVLSASPQRISRKCAACESEETLRTKRVGTDTAGDEAPATVDEVLRSPGQPLDAATRAFFEPRFGYDFGKVRIHTGIEADAAAASVRARAFTLGRDVVFAAGEHDPRSESVRRLLAHELTHVVQQGVGSRHTGAAPATRKAGQKAELARGFNVGVRDAGVCRELAHGARQPSASTGLSTLQRAPVTSPDSTTAQTPTSTDGPQTQTTPVTPPTPDTGGGTEPIALDDKPNPACTRTILAEGTCAFLVENAAGRCCDPDNGIENKSKSKDIEGADCPSHKFTPLFTCDKHCKTARDKGCSDNDNWLAIPGNQFKNSSCGDIHTICANGKNTTGYVREKSVTDTSFEVSPGIQAALGVTPGGSFKGAVYRPGASADAIAKDGCCNKPSAPSTPSPAPSK